MKWKVFKVGKMSRILVLIMSVSVCMALSVHAVSQVTSLDKYKAIDTEKDWLIDGSPYKAGIYRSDDDKNIILSNGLIRRVFRVSGNCGAVGFDNLMTGESILRALSPEAEIVLSGTNYKVGGFSEVPWANRAYLTPERIAALKGDEEAMQFIGFETGPIEKRFDYKPVGNNSDYNWPPKGVHLRLDYKLPKGANLVPNRKLLFEEKFADMDIDPGWTIKTSDLNERSSFMNEGKMGEIYTLGNTCVYAERKLDPETEIVQARFDTGTDKSQSWGPGIALIWPNKASLKFHVRPSHNRFQLWSNATGEILGGAIHLQFGAYAEDDNAPDLSKPISLRVRLTPDKIFCEASQDDRIWENVFTIPNVNEGKPELVRIGKSSNTGGDEDHTAHLGELVRLRVMGYAAFGAAEKVKSENPEDSAITVSIHYNLYDGLPLMSKWLTIDNYGSIPVHLDTFTSEILAYVERDSSVASPTIPGIETRPNMHVESDYEFFGDYPETATSVIHWGYDKAYTSQVNFMLKTKCLLKTYLPKNGPDIPIEAGDTFESFRVYEMPYDSYERQRQGLYRSKMYRTIAPWTQENPLMHHVRYADWETVKNAIDQSAEVGFEMVIMTFGSGFSIGNKGEAHLKEMKRYADYAHSKGLRIGGYSLLASGSAGGGNDIIPLPGESPVFGQSPCLVSGWGKYYFEVLYNFYEKTGMDFLEHDGSYPGDFCNATNHDHKSYESSQWLQWKLISDYYKWCRARGIFLNVPDLYFMNGSNKSSMGYREWNWSLPRAEQLMHTRQNIYDGTWTKPPSMGWMFVPLTQYHGGGAAATIEPLDTHIDHYERMIQSNLAMGVQACYRGPRLYDTDRVRDMVKRNVDWYKKYRGILESDLIHGRRCDAQDIDWMLHANPKLKEKGMLVVFNPLKEKVKRTIKANLYYTGLTKTAKIRQQEGKPKTYNLARDYTVEIPVEIEAEGFTWFVVE